MAEALQSCFLARKFAVRDNSVREIYAVVTVMARALEQARQRAGAEDYNGLDLRNVPIPEGTKPFERWSVPLARSELERLGRIREKTGRRHVADGSAGVFEQGNGEIIACGF